MLGQLALWKYGRGYALYEKGELIAVFVYRKGALRVAELLAQSWPTRFGKTNCASLKVGSSRSTRTAPAERVLYRDKVLASAKAAQPAVRHP
jgi:hypothetical protein